MNPHNPPNGTPNAPLSPFNQSVYPVVWTPTRPPLVPFIPAYWNLNYPVPKAPVPAPATSVPTVSAPVVAPPPTPVPATLQKVEEPFTTPTLRGVVKKIETSPPRSARSRLLPTPEQRKAVSHDMGKLAYISSHNYPFQKAKERLEEQKKRTAL